MRGNHTDATKPMTVTEALHEYERDLTARGGLVSHVQRVRRLLTPVLLDRPVGLLVYARAAALARWRARPVG